MCTISSMTHFELLSEAAMRLLKLILFFYFLHKVKYSQAKKKKTPNFVPEENGNGHSTGNCLFSIELNWKLSFLKAFCISAKIKCFILIYYSRISLYEIRKQFFLLIMFVPL